MSQTTNRLTNSSASLLQTEHRLMIFLPPRWESRTSLLVIRGKITTARTPIHPGSREMPRSKGFIKATSKLMESQFVRTNNSTEMPIKFWNYSQQITSRAKRDYRGSMLETSSSSLWNLWDLHQIQWAEEVARNHPAEDINLTNLRRTWAATNFTMPAKGMWITNTTTTRVHRRIRMARSIQD